MSISRQVSSRNQRNKGFMWKYSLQICLLLAICFWLLYQMKHSHDKRKEIEETHSRIMNEVDEKQPEIFQINRKTLPIGTGMGKETQNVEEAKGEADESLHMSKLEEIEDEGKKDESDEIFEQDQERDDEEAEHGEFSDEEEKGEQVANSDLLGKEDHDAGIQKTREERFNGDDASNAVADGNRKSVVESGDSESSDEKIDGLQEGRGESFKSVDTSIAHTNGNGQQEILLDGDSNGEDKEVVENTREKEGSVASFMNSNEEAEHGNANNMKKGTVDSDLEDVQDVFKVDEPNPFPGIIGNIPNDIVINGTETETRELEDGSLSNSTLALSTDSPEQKSNTMSTTTSDAQAEHQSDRATTMVTQGQTEVQESGLVIDMTGNSTQHLQNAYVQMEGTSHSQEMGRTEQLEPNGNNETLVHMEGASSDLREGRKHTDANGTIIQMEDSSDRLVALGEHLGSATSTEDPNERFSVLIVDRGLGMAEGKYVDISRNVLIEEQKKSQVDSSILQSTTSNNEVAAE